MLENLITLGFAFLIFGGMFLVAKLFLRQEDE